VKNCTRILLLSLTLSVGCDSTDVSVPAQELIKVRIEPLPAQQARIYPETSTRMFVSLVDFEDVGDSERGFDQVDLFSVVPPAPQAEKKFVVNITRTGAGAMVVTLPPGSHLLFTIPQLLDFSEYSLVSFAVHSESLRDDLCVLLNSSGSSWTSHRTLILPGWNTVLIDIQRLASVPGFEIDSVRSIGLRFADAVGPVRFHLDDIMLVDNVREIEPSPSGIVLRKKGLDYEIHLPDRSEPVGLLQGSDGLWRISGDGATLQLGAPTQVLPPSGERLELMGPKKVGNLELLEHNSIRLRLANTWYFPARGGEWYSLAVRRIRWEYTIYSDARWVTSLELNNSGGQPISMIRLWLGGEVGWSDGAISPDLVVRDFSGPVGRWSYLSPPKGLRSKVLLQNYIRPGKIRPVLTGAPQTAEGDLHGDGFDESQGCYFLTSTRGHCRFTILPPEGGLLNPAFRVGGPWNGPVSVNVQGFAVRKVEALPDGSVLFVVPGWVRQSVAVEVAGSTQGGSGIP